MTTVNFNVRIDKQLKDDANAIFEEYGMTMAQAFRMFLTSVAKTRAVPLSLDYQSQSTLDAINELKSGQVKSYDVKSLDDASQLLHGIADGQIV